MSSLLQNPFRDPHPPHTNKHPKRLSIRHITHDETHPTPAYSIERRTTSTSSSVQNSRARELGIRHTTYDEVHLLNKRGRDSGMGSRNNADEKNTELVKTYLASPPPAPGQQRHTPPHTHNSLTSRFQTYIHSKTTSTSNILTVPFPKSSTISSKQPPFRHHSKTSGKKSGQDVIPKITLLYSTPLELGNPTLNTNTSTTTITTNKTNLHPPTAPKLPPSDEEIIAFLGIKNSDHSNDENDNEDSDSNSSTSSNFQIAHTNHKWDKDPIWFREGSRGWEEETSSENGTNRGRRTKRAEMEEASEAQQLRTPKPIKGHDETPYETQNSNPHQSHPSNSPHQSPHNREVRTRKDSKLLPPMPIRSTSPPFPQTTRPSKVPAHHQQHKRDLSAHKLATYLQSGSSKLYETRQSLHTHLSASATRAAKSYKVHRHRHENASDSSIESFWCKGDGEGEEMERHGESDDKEKFVRKKNEARCRLCRGTVASNDGDGGLCRACKAEYARPQTQYFTNSSKEEKNKEGLALTGNIHLAVPPRQLTPAPSLVARDAPTTSSANYNVRGHAQMPSISRMPSPHPLGRINLSTVEIPLMPRKIPARYANETVIVPASSTQHIALQLRSPTLITHTRTSSAITHRTVSETTRTEEEKKRNFLGIWGKYHAEGVREWDDRSNEDFDVGKVRRDELFYKLYDEVLNDYGGRDVIGRRE